MARPKTMNALATGEASIEEYAEAISRAEGSPEFDAERAVRGRKKDVLDPDPATRDETPVMVVCVSDLEPVDHEENRLAFKHKYELPRWVADLMASKGQVVII